MENKEILVASAILAVSNMGHPRPDRGDIQRVMQNKKFNLDTFVVAFAERYMERDEDYDIFIAEAQSWVDQLTQDEDWKANWADISELMAPRPENTDIIKAHWPKPPFDWDGRKIGVPYVAYVSSADIPEKLGPNCVSYRWEEGKLKGRPEWRIIGTYMGHAIVVENGPMR